MIAVVTGSSGFVGSHLVEALIADGWTVRAALRPESKPASPDDRLSYHTVDLHDKRSVHESNVWNGATHVFHVAGVTRRRTLAQFRDGNVIPTANIYAGLAARDNPPRVILVSSQAAAGPASSSERAITERDVPHPVELYGRSKLEAEQLTAHYATVPTVIVRPSAVYGPGDPDFLAVFREATRAIGFLPTRTNQLLSLVHVSDLVGALISVAISPHALGKTYFVTSPLAVSWGALCDEIAITAGSRARMVRIPRFLATVAGTLGDAWSAVTRQHALVGSNKIRLSRPDWWVCDPSKIYEDLDWRAHVALADGVRETYAWYTEAGWLRPPRKRVRA